MPLPIVAIVGRPNVGKSSLFNCLAGRRISIVEPTAGVTRDRVSVLVEDEGRWLELVDTGGVGLESGVELAADIDRQISTAIREASLIVFVVDIREGLMPLDRTVAERLRGLRTPVIVAANKADTDRLAAGVGEFYALGYEPVLATSAKHNRGRRDLLAAIRERLPAENASVPAEVAMKIAVVGKRNAGKSTFINSLAGSERVIVSEIPGTTRDAVDIRFEKDGLTYVAIDTAGIRKKKSLASDIDFYSLTRALESIRRADVVLFLIDAVDPVSGVEKRLGAEIEHQMKPVVLVVNKWDLAKDRAATSDYAEYLTKVMPGLEWAPLVFTSARDSKNVESAIDLARTVYKQASTRVTTSRLNQVLEEAMRLRRPPSPQVRLPKVYFATQVAVRPPTIVCFVNDPALFSEDYRRFIENRFREALPFAEVPMRLTFRAHREEGEDRRSGGRQSGRAAARRGQRGSKRPHRPKGRPGAPKRGR
jgi:GTP-binding protein